MSVPSFSLQAPQAVFTTALSGVEPGSRSRPAAAVFGAPLDRTECFRTGTGQGPAAIRRLSDSLETYSPRVDRDLEDLELLDLGDLDFDDCSVEDALEAIADAAEVAASLAPLAIMLGGEHTITLGGFRGIKRLHPDALLVHVDAHADLREQYEGEVEELRATIGGLG